MKQPSVVALVTLAALGCSSGGGPAGDPTAPPVGLTPRQLEGLSALEARTGQAVRVVPHAARRQPMHLSTARTGTPILARHDDAVTATLALLEESRALFDVREPAVELSPARAETDALGMTHARFQQVAHGVPVVGAELMAHFDAAGRLASIDSNYVAEADLPDVNPALSADQARARSVVEVLARSLVAEASLEVQGERLVVHVPDERSSPPRLAYEHRVRALAAKPPAIWVVTVDAKTGEVLSAYDDLKTVDARGVGVMGDQKAFRVSTTQGGFVMTDPTNTAVIRTLTAEQQQDRGRDVTSRDPNSWDTGVPGAGAAVDAHFHAAIVYRYYKEKHGRSSIDGAGGPLLSTAHFGVEFENAAWDGTGMLYGDGGSEFRPLSASLDVVGHEFTHGVIDSTSKLAYRNQSGALNEAVADIFGAFIEHSLSPDATKNWVVGEAAHREGEGVRDMRDPSAVSNPQPAHMSRFVNTQQDNGGVHVNSGIINHAAYLMTVGGVNPVSKVRVVGGIGWEKSEKLWYRANSTYFLENTNFGQAAQGVLQAAKDIGLSESEINIVDCAFKAVGVAQGACAAIVAPKSSAAEADSTEADDDEASEASDDSAPRTRRLRRVTTESTGCSAAPAGASGSSIALAAAVAATVLRRRRRPQP